MASRRMFSKRIISSARFMKLTRDAQILYFHLCMNADDDGAVEGYPVRRAIGVEEDAYANLEGRGFIRTLDRDNEVVYIEDWDEHNKIRADRIQPSMYRELIAATVEGAHLIEPKTRSDIKRNKAIDVSAGTEVAGPSTDRQRPDNGPSTDGPRTDNGPTMDRLGEVSIGEVKTVKVSKGQGRKTFKAPSREEAETYYREKGFHFDLQFFLDYFNETGWIDSQGKHVKSWKQKMITWEHQYRSHEAKKKPRQEIMQHEDGDGTIWGESL